jgi:hypothetical protein
MIPATIGTSHSATNCSRVSIGWGSLCVEYGSYGSIVSLSVPSS